MNLAVIKRHKNHLSLSLIVIRSTLTR